MNLVMMGTGPFARPTLERLYDTPHCVAALFTQPPRPVQGKPGKLHPNPMRDLAESRGTPILTPDNVNTPAAQQQLAALEPDLLVVCDYGQILAPETLALAKFGGVNLHASLLPKYRGAAPIQWAIYRGERETGNSVIHMTPQIDAGPIIGRQTVAIGHDETAEQLEPRLAALGAELVVELIDKVFAGEAAPLEQNPGEVTRARRLRKEDGQVKWPRAAEQIRNQVRAFTPWPKTFTHWQRPDKEPLRVTLEQLAIEPYSGDAAPGEVLEASGGRLLIATGENAVRIERLQPAGKRVLDAAEFLRGYPVQPGERFA